jgi:1-aminocyclopropane-1-carboxylate deaminase
VVKDSKVAEWITQEAGLHKNYTLLDVPYTGTYGNASDELIYFINTFYSQHKILLDPLYTGKLLFGIFALIKNKQWRWGKNILIIHTGGIQAIEGFNIRQKQKGKPCIIH